MAVVPPLAKPHLCNEVRVDPLHVTTAHARHFRSLGKGRGVPMQRFEQLPELADLRVVEARADVADVAQAVALVGPEDERAERPGATARTARVAGDDELLVVLRLDLQPVARPPALLVRAAR